MTEQLFQRVALVTGGAGLLGKQHAIALAEEGAIVVIADANRDAAQGVAEELTGTFGAERAIGVHLDITDPGAVEKVHEELTRTVGPVDILINNAAVNPKVEDDSRLSELSRFENFSLDEWEHQIRVGLTGSFICSKVFGSAMAVRKSGVILNIASDLSVIAPDQRLYSKPNLQADQQPVKPVTYSVIKTGLVGLTRYLATYWAEQGIRVNALSPGGVYNNQPEDFVTKLNQLIPMGRMARFDEYKQAVVFLVSDASSYMTGQNIVMDGGRSVW